MKVLNEDDNVLHICTGSGDENNPSFDGHNLSIVLQVQNITYEVGRGKKKKDILKHVNAKYMSGNLVSVMGPSGAGKTTFLNLLSNNRSKQQIREGAVTLNGEKLPKNYERLCSYIPQNDVLYPALTPRQAFLYAANLRLPTLMPSEKKIESVNTLLRKLHLEKCADTIVGSDSKRGISGGEKKRTSIGLELIVNPAIVLVDEPTSGLDSKMAEDVVEMLREISHNSNRLILCTIHQPSWKVFQRFDKLTLLNQGRVVYNGNADKVIKYFEMIGFSVPSFENPMDFYFSEIQTHSDEIFFSSKWQSLSNEEIKYFDHDDSAAEICNNQLTSTENLVQKLSSNKNSLLSQFRILLNRAAVDTFRDKEKFTQGLVMKLMTGIMVGIIFINQADQTNASIFPSNSALFFIIVSSTMDTTQKALMEYPLIKPLLIREYRNGAFSLFPYFLAQLVNNSFFDTLTSIFYMPAYFLVGLNLSIEAIFYFIAIICLLTVIGVELGLMLGSNAADIKEAQNYFIPLVMPQIVFGGFFIPVDQIPVYFKWIYYISYFQYGLSAAVINEFADTEFSDCSLPQNDLSGNVTASNQVLSCFSDGETYLLSLELETKYLGRNLIILLGFIVACLPLTYFSIRHAIKKGALEV